MKNYKQILEAINRGIKFALDDFDDNEQIQGQVNSKVKYQGGIKEYLDLMNDVVDLGLPSGTCWFKYNFGCNYKKLNKEPNNSIPEDWCGDYYAWGELDPNKIKNKKIYFNWDNYKFGKNYNQLTKYNIHDGLTQLLPEDDVIYQNIGYEFNISANIPTKKQFDELKKYTKKQKIYNYNPNKVVHNQANDGGIQGLNGILFISKINKNFIFVPDTGYYYRSNICADFGCFSWSSNIDNAGNACYLYCDSADKEIHYMDCYYGLPIRPVISNKIIN